ncbi:hypothetical protein [Priestia sp. JNUCC 25]
MKKFLLLEKVDVMITDNEDIIGSIRITEENYQTDFIVPTSLYYRFTVKNICHESIFCSDLHNVKLTIEPDKTLLTVINKALGWNIYDTDENKLGWSQTVKEIEPKKVIEFSLVYILGEEQNNVIFSPLPSKEALQEIKDNALKATLVVSQDIKEIARFKLDLDKNNIIILNK